MEGLPAAKKVRIEEVKELGMFWVAYIYTGMVRIQKQGELILPFMFRG